MTNDKTQMAEPARINENTLIQLNDGTVITYGMYIQLLSEMRG